MIKTPPDPIKKARVRSIIARMIEAYGIEKKALSEVLGCQLGTINNWVHFARIPYEQVEKCSTDTGKSLDWLLNGKTAAHQLISQSDIADLLAMMKAAIEGALEYETIEFCYPDAGEKLLNKLKKDLERWTETKDDHKPSANGDDTD